MSREHLEQKIKCPECGAEGVVHYSDNDYTFMSKNVRAIDQVEGAFDVTLTPEERFSMTCKKCGHGFVA